MRIGLHALACAVVFAATATPARAHGIGQTFVLPLPLWLWLTGAAASIVLTFAVLVFLRAPTAGRGSSHVWPSLPQPALTTLRAILLALLAFVTLAGFIGAQDAYGNVLPVFVWVLWWVGFAMVAALIGDVWHALNPFRTLYRALTLLVPSIGLRPRSYPAWLGAWPAVAIFLLFAWAELVWEGNDSPRNLATAIVAYTAFTLAAMATFGPELWLQRGEAFSIAFSVFGRFAPIQAAGQATTGEGVGGGRGGELRVRWWGAGLLSGEAVSVSFLVFVLAMLATVTYDGFLETPAFVAILNAVYESQNLFDVLYSLVDWTGLSDLQLLETFALLCAPLLFVPAYALTAVAMRGLAASAGGPRLSVRAVATAFVLSLVPIAVAYHLSHYFVLLLTAGQSVIVFVSDPMGWGWDLFGTRDYVENFSIVNPYVFWYTAATLIVVGHVLAVYVAHVIALRLFATARAAWLSQLPMMALMIAYTVSSLWIMAQPMVG